jgi:hypothetical protein
MPLNALQAAAFARHVARGAVVEADLVAELNRLGPAVDLEELRTALTRSATGWVGTVAPAPSQAAWVALPSAGLGAVDAPRQPNLDALQAWVEPFDALSRKIAKAYDQGVPVSDELKLQMDQAENDIGRLARQLALPLDETTRAALKRLSGSIGKCSQRIWRAYSERQFQHRVAQAASVSRQVAEAAPLARKVDVMMLGSPQRTAEFLLQLTEETDPARPVMAVVGEAVMLARPDELGGARAIVARWEAAAKALLTTDPSVNAYPELALKDVLEEDKVHARLAAADRDPKVRTLSELKVALHDNTTEAFDDLQKKGEIRIWLEYMLDRAGGTREAAERLRSWSWHPSSAAMTARWHAQLDAIIADRKL